MRIALVPDQRIFMSVARTRARAATVVVLNAALLTGAVLPSAAASRPAAVDPTAIAASQSAARAANAEERKASEAVARAEQVRKDTRQRLDRAEGALLAARDRLTKLSGLVAEAVEQRLDPHTSLLDVAADAAQVAADVGIVAPVIEVLDPLAQAVDDDRHGDRPRPEPSRAERALRLARADAVHDHRVAADEAARAQEEAEDAAAALAAADKTARKVTAKAAVATEKADAFVASLGIDKRLVRPGAGAVSSPFGMRPHPVTRAFKRHTGVDFQYADGRAYAAAEGTVVDVRFDPAYGTLITIAHGKRISTRYAHLAATSVQPGERVSAGQVVGRIGSTGVSTGPHLHFEIQVDGRFRDPAGWLWG